LYFWRYYSPLKPVIFSIERTKEELLIDMFSIHLKQNLTWFSDGHEAVDYLNQPEIAELCEDFIMDEFGEPSMFVIDERRGNVDALKKQIERAVKQYNSKLVIIDVLTDVLRSLPLNEQDDFMLWEKQMKKEGIVFINVCHTRKDQAGTQKPKDENGEETFKRVDEYDIHGTSSIPQSADYNIVLNRNKNASDPIEKNTTYISLPKNREFSDTGELLAKAYYRASCSRLYPFSFAEQHNFFQDDKFGDIIPEDMGWGVGDDFNMDEMVDNSEIGKFVEEVVSNEDSLPF